MSEDFTVIAIVAAYNEADIIGDVVGALIDEGVQVYLIDNASDDGTVAQVERYRARGVIGIERFDSGGAFAWEALLKRKEALSRELDADWFIHHDADEFRESPWPGMPLREAIRRVDASGYNAIDFEVLNFWPTQDDRVDGQDIREAFRHYDRSQPFDRLQVKCWKKTAEAVNLVASGGHEAAFAGRRIFPIRFLLRHYPIRGQAHGERKVMLDRRSRFLPQERAQGWHVRYGRVREDTRFIRDPCTLTLYDPDAVRLRLLTENRRVEELTATTDAQRREIVDLTERLRARDQDLQGLAASLTQSKQEAESLGREVEALRADAESERRHAEMLQESLASAGRDVETLRREIAACLEHAQVLRANVASAEANAASAEAEVVALRASRSWRITAPLRAAQRLLLGR